MNSNDLSEINQLRQHAQRLGIYLPDAKIPPYPISCFGHSLPVPFVWLCQHYPQHSGFPHPHYWTHPTVGLLSPIGDPSDLERHNQDVRSWEPDWPTHWVSLWHGNDDDYCFSFVKAGHPWVIYWYYNAGEQFLPFQFKDDYEFATFADWFGNQVDWALAQQSAKRG